MTRSARQALQAPRSGHGAADRGTFRIIAAITLMLFLAAAWPARPDGGGRYVGRVVVEWLEETPGADRKMRLLEPFGFVDWQGVAWQVPEGAEIDGASIPRAFWTAFGPPFVGDYRRASVVHDYYCQTKDRPWPAVHRMFYDGLLAADVPRAKVMYAAVLAGGPRWTRIAGAEPGTVRVIASRPQLSEAELNDLEEWIEREDPDLSTLERRVLSGGRP